MKIEKYQIVEEDFQAIEASRIVYQLVINSLIYAMLDIRLDIVYTISIISRYKFNLNKSY